MELREDPTTPDRNSRRSLLVSVPHAVSHAQRCQAVWTRIVERALHLLGGVWSLDPVDQIRELENDEKHIYQHMSWP